MKRLYGLTNKRNAEKQIARRYRRMEKAEQAYKRHTKQAKQRRGGRSTDLPMSTGANDEDHDMRYHVSPSLNKPTNFSKLVTDGRGDPAYKVCLKMHSRFAFITSCFGLWLGFYAKASGPCSWSAFESQF